jgi:hypothetical protein
MIVSSRVAKKQHVAILDAIIAGRGRVSGAAQPQSSFGGCKIFVPRLDVQTIALEKEQRPPPARRLR